jgi:predicted acyltransferase
MQHREPAPAELEKSDNLAVQQITNAEQTTLMDQEKLLIPKEPTAPKKARLICLDVLRGLTMVGMIMVDSMGDFDYVIWPLRETVWNGLTTADCVFPSFLFIMGLAVPLALKQEDRFKGVVWKRIIKRFVLMFLIGMALNFQGRIPKIFTTSPFTGWRIMGVLQRISICYLTISSTYLLFTKFWFHYIFIGSCLAIYLGFMYGFNVPAFNTYQCGRGVTSEECNFGAYMDRSIFGSKRFMMWPNDPEGLFTTLTAFLNTFAGLCFSLLMRRNSQQKGSNLTLLKMWGALSVGLAAVGGLAAIGEPVCKKRWSVSFAFITSGLSGAALCLCFVLVDMLDKPIIKEKLIKPFLWLGMNPLFIFVAMIFFDSILMDNI